MHPRDFRCSLVTVTGNESGPLGAIIALPHGHHCVSARRYPAATGLVLAALAKVVVPWVQEGMTSRAKLPRRRRSGGSKLVTHVLAWSSHWMLAMACVTVMGGQLHLAIPMKLPRVNCNWPFQTTSQQLRLCLQLVAKGSAS